MHDLPLSPNVENHNVQRVVARQHYFRLRDELVSLKSALQPNLAAIDSVIQELECWRHSIIDQVCRSPSDQVNSPNCHSQQPSTRKSN